MPSEVMDRRRMTSFYLSSAPSSFFSEEIRFPAERTLGFWTPESLPDNGGKEGSGLMSGNRSVASSPLEKLSSAGTNSVESLEVPQPYLFTDQKTNFTLEYYSRGAERTGHKCLASWGVTDKDCGSRPNLRVQRASLSMEDNKVDLNGRNCVNGVFSSSFTEVFNKKLALSSSKDCTSGQSGDTIKAEYVEDELFGSLEEIEAQTIGNLLPDDDDLLSGIIDGLDYNSRPNSGDDIEDDLFYSGGGMELEVDLNFDCNETSDVAASIGASDGLQGGANGSFGGEHPFGEHPSRTLFVRNINSNVEDAELKDLFEQYGQIRRLYTACKHRGFVMIAYYDIRAALNAMKALQSKPLRRRKLDIHFSLPKINPTEKDVNQGTLVVFNLDSSVSNDDLRQIFGVYGEIKEIRETPLKRHEKFIEFFDVRAADAALRALNRSDIAGKKIKLEPSRPGGARGCCLTQELSPELVEEEPNNYRQASPPINSPPGCYGSVPLGSIASSGLDNGSIQGLHSAVRAPNTTIAETALRGISSSLSHNFSSARVGQVADHHNLLGHSDHGKSLGQMNFGFQSIPGIHPHSLPEYRDVISNGIPYNHQSSMSALPISIRPPEGVDNRHVHGVGAGGLSSHSFDPNEAAFGVLGNGNCPLHGHQYVMGNSNSYHNHPPGTMMWLDSPTFAANNIPTHTPSQMHGLPRPPSHMLNSMAPLHHHVGSAPAVNPSIWDRRNVYAADTTELSAFHPGSLGSMSFSGSPTMHPLELASHNMFPHMNGNCLESSISSSHIGIPSSQNGHVFHGRNSRVSIPSSFDTPFERIRNRRSDTSASHGDNKKQFELDVDRILRGEDSRTTLMIKNIPNKYTSKMLLAAIDEHHRGTYDFIYLPIDFKNKCNVGYAFINMTDPQKIISFYQAFNGKKWEKFNSEKVASLAYARIQGKAALISHFQNSSLMNEDKRCRPILFHSGGPNAGDQEPFPMGTNIRSRSGRSRTASSEENHQGSPSTIGDEPSNGTASSIGSTKDSE